MCMCPPRRDDQSDFLKMLTGDYREEAVRRKAEDERNSLESEVGSAL